MRITSFLLAGFAIGALMSVMGAERACAQDEHSAIMCRYAQKPPVYPDVRTWHPAYRKAVKYGMPPVLPPWITCLQQGRGLYDGPYYKYPRPALGCPGYAGIGGPDPVDFRKVIPPPIPPRMPPPINAPAQDETPTAPMPSGEAIPTPSSDPASQS
jgi:hypothetical protein